MSFSISPIRSAAWKKLLEAIDEYLPDEVHEEINSALVFPTIPEAWIKQAVATNRKAVIESLAKIRGWELPAT